MAQRAAPERGELSYRRKVRRRPGEATDEAPPFSLPLLDSVGRDVGRDDRGHGSDRLTTAAILRLQRTQGNRSVERLLGGGSPAHSVRRHRTEPVGRTEDPSGVEAIARQPGDASAPASPLGSFAAAVSGPAREIPFRAEMERSFGQDFSGVRTYLGRAAELGSLRARAATRGEDVAFAGADPTKDLVAHELTHVVQQRRAGGAAVVQGKAAISRSDDPAEREAEAVAGLAAAGQAVRVTAAPAAGIHLAGEYDRLGGTQKQDIDTRADAKYQEQVPIFEGKLGKALSVEPLALQGATKLVKKFEQMVDVAAAQTNQRSADLLTRVMSVENTQDEPQAVLQTMGAITARFKVVKRAIEEGNLREKMTMVYTAIRNRYVESMIQMADRAMVDASLPAADQGQKAAAKEWTDIGLDPAKLAAGRGGQHGYFTREREVREQDRIVPGNPRWQQAHFDKQFNDANLTPEMIGQTQAPMSYQELKAAFPRERQDLKSQQTGSPLDALMWKGRSQEQKRLLLTQQVRNQPTQWKPGAINYQLAPDLQVQQNADAVKARLLSGLSGSTDMFMHAADYVGLTLQEKQWLRLACLGTMLPAGDHSYYEIMRVAKLYGLADYVDGPEGYRTLAPLAPQQILAKVGLRVFPGDYLRMHFKDWLAARLYPQSALPPTPTVTPAPTPSTAPTAWVPAVRGAQPGQPRFVLPAQGAVPLPQAPQPTAPQPVLAQGGGALPIPPLAALPQAQPGQPQPLVAQGGAAPTAWVPPVLGPRPHRPRFVMPPGGLPRPVHAAVPVPVHAAAPLPVAPQVGWTPAQPRPRPPQPPGNAPQAVPPHALPAQGGGVAPAQPQPLAPLGGGPPPVPQVVPQPPQRILPPIGAAIPSPIVGAPLPPAFVGAALPPPIVGMPLPAQGGLPLPPPGVAPQPPKGALPPPVATPSAAPTTPPIPMSTADLTNPGFTAPASDYQGKVDYQDAVRGNLKRNLPKIEGLASLSSPSDPAAGQYADASRLKDVGHLEDFQEIDTSPYRGMLQAIEANPRNVPKELKELAGIYAYSREVYTKFNNALNDDKYDTLTAMEQRLLRLAVSGLRSMKPYTGGTVYMGHFLPFDTGPIVSRPAHARLAFWNHHYPRGKTERWSQFLSTSKRIGTSFIGNQGRDSAEIITNVKTGVDITLIAQNPDQEREVMFPPGTTLKVGSVEDQLDPRIPGGGPPKTPANQLWTTYEEA